MAESADQGKRRKRCVTTDGAIVLPTRAETALKMQLPAAAMAAEFRWPRLPLLPMALRTLRRFMKNAREKNTFCELAEKTALYLAIKKP